MACADVNSANVVGYQTLNMLANGRKTMSFTFKNVGEDTMDLADIKVVGYQDSSFWKDEEEAPKIYMKHLATDGHADVTYLWKDSYKKATGWKGGYWQINAGDDVEIGHVIVAGDVSVNPGEGYFVEAPVLRTGCTAYSLQINGEVIKGDYAAELLANGRLIIGNMMPTPCWLTDVEVQGYQDSSFWKDEEEAPKIYMKHLATDGHADVTYLWKDSYKKATGWKGGYWQINAGDDVQIGTIIEKGVNDVNVNPGDGWFVEAPVLRSGVTAYTLVFPKCLD